jgi:hypothetical protein
MRAGIQNVLVFGYFTGFRVSPKTFGLARNDSFVELRNSLPEEREHLNLFGRAFWNFLTWH